MYRYVMMENSKTAPLPKIYIDKENDFISIKIAVGVENKSYEKDGFIFCEDKAGQVIEIQILNVSSLSQMIQKS